MSTRRAFLLIGVLFIGSAFVVIVSISRAKSDKRAEDFLTSFTTPVRWRYIETRHGLNSIGGYEQVEFLFDVGSTAKLSDVICIDDTRRLLETQLGKIDCSHPMDPVPYNTSRASCDIEIARSFPNPELPSRLVAIGVRCK